MLKCLRTLKCTRLQDFAHTISIFFGVIYPGGPSQKRPHCLDPDTNFRLARQRSHCSCFTKRLLIDTPATHIGTISVDAASRRQQNQPIHTHARTHTQMHIYIESQTHQRQSSEYCQQYDGGVNSLLVT